MTSDEQVRERVSAVFQECDLNCDGDITKDELTSVLECIEPSYWNKARINGLFQALDKNGDEVIKYDELLDWLFDKPSHKLFKLADADFKASGGTQVLDLATKTDMEEPEIKLSLRVVLLSGDAILERAELAAHEKVGVLTNLVQQKLEFAKEAELFVDGRKLRKHDSIKASGLTDGDTVTAVIKNKVMAIKLRNAGATVVLKADGSVSATGSPNFGGDCSAVQTQLASDVHSMYTTWHEYSGAAFAALKADGSLVVWGSAEHGGDCHAVQEQLTSDVRAVCCTEGAFAILKADGSVVAWGGKTCGGDCQALQDQLNSEVKLLCSTTAAFAALKVDGSVVAWGCPYYGGDCVDPYYGAGAEELSSEVESIHSTEKAFAALKADGTVVAWGKRTELWAAKNKACGRK